MWVLAEEPLPEVTVEEFRAYFADKNTEQDLADACAILHAKVVWHDDETYDYDEGTTAYEYACTVVDAWEDLEDEYHKKIFAILKSEGGFVPEMGYFDALKPFMARNGYAYKNGWWICEEDVEAEKRSNAR